MSLVKKISGAKYKVTFTFESNFAKKVQLLGDFNAWDANTTPMKSSKDKFSIDIELPANSSFQFRYLIDGQAWDNDSNADYYVDSPFSGIQNSVVVLDTIAGAVKPSNITTKAPLQKAFAAPKKAVVASKETKIEKAVTVKETQAKKISAKAVTTPAKKVEAPAKKAISKTVVPAKKKVAASAKADDLTIIEGIGPKIAEILVKGGISTFTNLSKSKAADVKKLLDTAGNKFAMHDPATWGKQAALAASGDMAGLNKLKDELIGGKKKK